MTDNQNQQASAQVADNRTVTASSTRMPGVPSRPEMYQILKERSLQLQRGDAKE